MSELIKTYVNGFDHELGGGIPEGHVVLLSGAPGTMKSSLSLNLLYNNMKSAEKRCVYISLEESRKSLETIMKTLGMEEFDEQDLFIVDMGKLRLEYRETESELNMFDILQDFLNRRIKEKGTDIVVIDSLTALLSLEDIDNPRQRLFHFFGFLKKLDITSILITETPYTNDMEFPNREDFLADGNIFMKMYEVGEADIQLRIRCVKMRHMNHSRGYFALLHRGDRFTVTPVISE